MTDKEWVANVIGILRKRSGRSLRDVASYCEVRQSTVWAWEHSQAVPSAVSLIRLARLFEQSLEVFNKENAQQ